MYVNTAEIEAWGFLPFGGTGSQIEQEVALRGCYKELYNYQFEVTRDGAKNHGEILPAEVV